MSSVPAEIAGIGSSAMKLRVSPGFDPLKAQVGPDEYFVLSRIDGTQTLREVLLATGLPVERGIAIVTKLRSIGALLLPGETSAPMPVAVPKPPRPSAATPAMPITPAAGVPIHDTVEVGRAPTMLASPAGSAPMVSRTGTNPMPISGRIPAQPAPPQPPPARPRPPTPNQPAITRAASEDRATTEMPPLARTSTPATPMPANKLPAKPAARADAPPPPRGSSELDPPTTLRRSGELDAPTTLRRSAELDAPTIRRAPGLGSAVLDAPTVPRAPTAEIEIVLPRATEYERRLLAEPGQLSSQERLRILALARLVAARDPWALLGVASGSDTKALKRAYFKLSKDIHPDRFYGKQVGSFATVLSEVFEAVNRAYTKLTTPDKHRQSGVFATAVTAEQPQTPQEYAAELFERACALEVGGDALGAMKLFAAAVRIDPQTRYLRRAATCALAAEQPKTALEYAKKAQTQSPNDPSSARLLASAFRAVGRLADAEEVLVMAMALKNENDVLTAELRNDLAEVRRLLAG